MRKFSAWRSSVDENGITLIFRDAFDDMGDFGAEQLLDAFDVRERVLTDIMEKPGGDGDGVELELDQKLGDREGMDQVRFP